MFSKFFSFQKEHLNKRAGVWTLWTPPGSATGGSPENSTGPAAESDVHDCLVGGWELELDLRCKGLLMTGGRNLRDEQFQTAAPPA